MIQIQSIHFRLLETIGLRNILKIIIVSAGTLMLGNSCTPRNDQLRILTAGIRHESNTFNPYPTTLEDFTVLRGADMLEGQPYAKILEEAGVEVIPVLHAGTGPSGVVARDAYESFRDEILEGIRNAGKLDGIYLDMHGALQVEGYEDAQVDFIRQIRGIVGEEVVIAGSFDLHGNISPEFIEGLNIISAFRTAPHVDGNETRNRTVSLLLDALENGDVPHTVHINLPIIIPGEKGITAVEPLKTFYESLDAISSGEGIMDASIFVGMPWTDVYRAGMSVQVVARNAENLEEAQQEVVKLANAVWEKRAELKFDVPTASIDDAIESAVEAPESTVFITDSGDNITAGAAGDGTLVLERLLAHKVPDAVLAGIVDPEAVALCADAGIGAEVQLTVGGKVDTIFCEPVSIQATVTNLLPEQPGGTVRDAIVQVEGVTLVLLGSTWAFTDPSQFEAVGIDPLAHKIVVVKEGYLFQGLRDIAPRTIMALTPGFAYQLVENLPYQNLRRPIYPIDLDMEWNASQ